jgi:nitroreductase
MEFSDVIAQRHSTRDFADTAVERAALDWVFKAASSAPSAMNSQPWRYHVCIGESRLALGKIIAQATVYLEEYVDVLGPERYEDAVRWYSSMGSAPVLIGVSAPRTETDFETLNVLLSVGASLENLLLAATDEGLAACNITFAWWVRDQLDEFFGLAADRAVVAVIALGYPGVVPPAAPPKNENIAEYVE